MTRVVNIREAPQGWESDPNYVYIGRAGHGFDGEWGNPFFVKDHTEQEHHRVVEQYRGWLFAGLQMDHGVDGWPLWHRVKALAGKTLVCFCKPKPCHGDVLREYADFIDQFGQTMPRWSVLLGDWTNDS